MSNDKGNQSIEKFIENNTFIEMLIIEKDLDKEKFTNQFIKDCKEVKRLNPDWGNEDAFIEIFNKSEAQYKVKNYNRYIKQIRKENPFAGGMNEETKTKRFFIILSEFFSKFWGPIK